MGKTKLADPAKMSKKNRKFLANQLAQYRGACKMYVEYDGKRVAISDEWGNHHGESIPAGRPYRTAMADQQWADRQKSLEQILADLRADRQLAIRCVDADGEPYKDFVWE